MGDQQRRHLGLGHAHADAIAGDPRLRDLEDRPADAVPVADADAVIGQAIDGEVLPELTVGEVAPPQVPLPVAVGLDLVDEHGALLSAVTLRVALPVAVDVQAADHPAPVHRLLPDPGGDGLALPLDLTWQAHIDRQHAPDDPVRPQRPSRDRLAAGRVTPRRGRPGDSSGPAHGASAHDPPCGWLLIWRLVPGSPSRSRRRIAPVEHPGPCLVRGRAAPMVVAEIRSQGPPR
jgi:hypothetical protein